MIGKHLNSLRQRLSTAEPNLTQRQSVARQCWQIDQFGSLSQLPIHGFRHIRRSPVPIQTRGSASRTDIMRGVFPLAKPPVRHARRCHRGTLRLATHRWRYMCDSPTLIAISLPKVTLYLAREDGFRSPS